MCFGTMYGKVENKKAPMREKVKKALELEQEMQKLNRELKKVKAEYEAIMSDPYICDKVYGLKMGEII